ncbi:MAG: hypothetical protein PQJ50_16560 [Spirochaetales bacterium]|nr:hypothetical protein [Spirochaetales bacterium]
MHNPHQTYKEESGKTARFTLNWSPFVEMDRYLIHGIVPSEGGIFQVFVNDRGGLRLIHTEMSHYGGLRNRVRELIDPLYMGHNPIKKTVEDQQCFVRFSVFISIGDMQDVMNYLTGSEDSGRYDEVLVFEKELMQVRKLKVTGLRKTLRDD